MIGEREKHIGTTWERTHTTGIAETQIRTDRNEGVGGWGTKRDADRLSPKWPYEDVWDP